MLKRIPICDRSICRAIGGPIHSLEWVLPQIGDGGDVGSFHYAEPALRLCEEAVFPVIHPHRAKLGLGEVPDLVTFGRPLTSEQVCLVVAVEVRWTSTSGTSRAQI